MGVFFSFHQPSFPNLLLFFFHHLYKEKEENEYDKVIHWILKDTHIE